MTVRTKATIITTTVAIVTFILGPVLWPNGPELVPMGAQLPLFIAIGVLESVAFGLGVSFLIFGWPVVRGLALSSRGSAMALYASIGWQLLSWWPHDRMHASNLPGDVWRLIRIEYTFHFTLIVSAIVMAACFFDLLRNYPKAIKA